MILSVRSRHPGGVYGNLANGSVRFFSDNIDRFIWFALGTKDGEEVISDYGGWPRRARDHSHAA